jgi:Transposase DDE domain
MIREAATASKRGRQPDDSDAAIQARVTMKVLFGMALRQSTLGRTPVAAGRIIPWQVN